MARCGAGPFIMDRFFSRKGVHRQRHEYLVEVNDTLAAAPAAAPAAAEFVATSVDGEVEAENVARELQMGHHPTELRREGVAARA
jgi:hypothetical protein